MLLAGSAVVVSIDTQANPNLGVRFGVRGIPALYLLRHGQIIDQLAGAQTPEAVVAWFRRQVRG